MRLAPPPLALVAPGRRQLMGVGSAARLDAASFGSRLYLARLRRVQDASRHGCAPLCPRPRSSAATASCSTPWRCGCRCARSLASQRLPGVADVYPVATYHAADGHGAAGSSAPSRSGASTARTAGPGRQGRRDRRRHRCRRAVPRARRPARRRAGFPRGQRRFTSGRVIVARSFAGRDAPNADHLAFDPNVSEHGTHVSGILAGAYGTVARPGPRPAGRARPLGRGAGRLARQLPRARARRPRERRDRLDGRARGRRRPRGRRRHGRAQPLARRPADRPVRRCALAGARQCRARRRPLRRRRGQRLRHARLRLDLVARARARRRSPSRRPRARASSGSAAASAARARPQLTPFTAVPSIGPARDAARSRARRASSCAAAYGLDRRGCREPARRRRAARRRDRAARRLQLRREGDQRARGGRAAP